MAPIKLDKALSHFLDSVNWGKMKVGGRVKAVFEEVRVGSIMDIKHFAVLPWREESG